MDGLDRDAVMPDATGHAKPQPEALIHNSAATLGALDAVYADAAVDHADAEKSTADWQAKMNYHLLGTPANLIPGVGNLAQRYVDIGTAAYADGVKSKIDTGLKDNLSSHFSAGRQQLDAMVNYKMVMSGYDGKTLDLDGGIPQQLQANAGTVYDVGINNTYRAVFGRS